MRLSDKFKKQGEDYLTTPRYFFSVNLAESHEEDRLAMLGLLAQIIHIQDKRLDNAVKEFKKLTAKPGDHHLNSPD